MGLGGYYGHYQGHWLSATAFLYNNTGNETIRATAVRRGADLSCHAADLSCHAAGARGHLATADATSRCRRAKW